MVLGPFGLGIRISDCTCVRDVVEGPLYKSIVKVPG